MNIHKGSLEVICGSMFSGKTEELMRRLRRAEFAKQHVLTIKHHIDNRTSYSCITSHGGQERVAVPLEGTIATLQKILELAHDEVGVVGIDEVQFFPREIIVVIDSLVQRGKRVIAAGLDLDFRGQPFGVVPTLLAVADHVTKLKAICVLCGHDAYHSQRLINGKPARYDDPTIMVGAQECYQARCRNCFSLEGMPQPTLFSSP